jgi:hypothetical protein
MVMEQDIVKKITGKVIKRFPEMKEVRPSVKKRSNSNQKSLQFELTYKGKVKVASGHTINRIVRVVANTKGKILRMSTSK